MINEDFDIFYDKYQRFSAYVAYCMIGDYELAKDISQEVFISLYKSRDRLNYSNEPKLRRLVTKATTNKCIDHLRKSSSAYEILLLDDENGAEPADERDNPEVKILHMEEAKYQSLVLERLRKKNPVNYDILIKTKLYGIPAAEIAKEYGITVNNVNNRNLRSRAWLAEEMEKLCRQSK